MMQTSLLAFDCIYAITNQVVYPKKRALHNGTVVAGKEDCVILDWLHHHHPNVSEEVLEECLAVARLSRSEDTVREYLEWRDRKENGRGSK